MLNRNSRERNSPRRALLPTRPEANGARALLGWPVLFLFILFFLPALPTGAQTNVLTYHNDNARTGQNLNETLLTPNNVNSTNFGKLGFLSVDGLVDAQPLYVSKLTVAGSQHNVVFVVTEHDSVYAFDADTLAQLWKVTVLASGESTSDDRGCSQVTPEIGITSTPVIDLSAGPNGTIFAVAMSKDNFGNYHQRLHALDVTTGAEISGSPKEIQATYATAGGGTTTFAPGQYKERASLLLLNGVIYTSWASHCDITPYSGWVMGYSETTLQQVNIFNFTPNGSEGSVWMSGAGPAADSLGNIYFLAANGTFDTTLNANGFPVNGDYGNAFMKLSTSGNSLSAADYFTMHNTVAESNVDQDLGSGGALLLTDLTDSLGNIRHLAVGAGKDSIIYVADRDSMGKFNSTSDNIYQEISANALSGGSGVYAMPAYFNGTLYYGAVNDSLKAFTIANARVVAPPSSNTGSTFAYPGTTPSISANGTSNGILWAVENSGGTGILHAYDATNLANELYNSNQAGTRDQFSDNKFITPMIANGKVFVGTPTSVIVFGLLNGGTPPALLSIAVTPANSSIPNGTTQQFTATGSYSDGSTQNLTNSVTWGSSNTSVATINSAGLATSVGIGTLTVQATSGVVNGSTTLAVTSLLTISVTVSPATANVQAGFGSQQFTATVSNDAQNNGVTWSLSGSGCFGATCGTLSASSSASGAAITYTAPGSIPTPATVTLTATSISDTTHSAAATISITLNSTPTGSTFTESFGDSSNLCWSGGPSSCDQLWVAKGSGQSILATPGSPPPNTAGSNSLKIVETAGTASYIYTTGTFPRIPSGTAFDLYFTLNVSAQAMKAYDLTRLITASSSSDGTEWPAQISFRYDGINFQLQAAGSSSAPNVNISLNAWHTVQLHVASGTNGSYLVVDGGAQRAFTENARDFEYLVVGSAGGNLDAMTYYIGNVYVNSSLGGGPPPSMYIDFENSTDGTTITTDTLAASTHCGNGIWSLEISPLTGMTTSTNAQKRLPSPVTTCGKQYTDAAGTRGLRYDMSQTDRYAAYNWSTTSGSASVGFFYKITVSDQNYYSVFAITASGGGDYAVPYIHGGSMYLETATGVSNPIPMSPNVWYWVTMQYNAGGTHYMQVYDTTNWTLLGSVSRAASGNYRPNGIEIGRTGSEPGYPSAYWYYDNIIVDYLTARFPIVPGTAPSLVAIGVTPANPSIAKGASQQFTATGTYSDASTQNLTSTVTWSSSNTAIATINSAGLASGVGTGSSTIQAASGSVAGSTTLTVTAVLSSITVTPTNPSIAKGTMQPFIATGTYSDGSTQNLTSTVTWRSSNTSVRFCVLPSL